MIRRYGSGLRALLMVTDGVLAALTMVATSAIRFGADWDVHWRGIIPDPVSFLVLYAILWMGILTFRGLYQLRPRWSIRGEATDLLRASVLMAAIVLGILFWTRLPDVSRSFLLLLFPAQYAVTLGTRVVLRLAAERVRARGMNQRFLVVVGAGPRGQAFAAKLEAHRALGLRVAGFVDEDSDYELPPRWPYLGTPDDLERILHERIVDEVAICLPLSQWSLVDAIAHLCEDEGKIVRVPMAPMAFLDHAFPSGRVEELDGSPVFSLVSGPDRALALATKRFADLVVSATALVVLSPLFLALAVGIRLDDRGPILFRQVRVGFHGRRFQVLKFRTMTTDAEDRYGEVVALSDPRAFKVTNDPRITRFGRFLRQTSLDELPQLWNVLRGEMSLVGPRPAPPREVEAYDLWHRRRLSMKPGITGLWQVTARRNDDFDERAQLDLDYIDRWSMWLDVKILFRTIPAALDGR